MATPPRQTYTLDELASYSGLPRRTVRYYIQIGLVPHPVGETRAAYYTPAHLEQLLTVAGYAKAGLSLQRIRELLHDPSLADPTALERTGAVSLRSHLTLGDGVELVVDPARAGLSAAQTRRLYEQALHLYAGLRKENADER